MDVSTLLLWGVVIVALVAPALVLACLRSAVQKAAAAEDRAREAQCALQRLMGQD